jgi:hypothetical protein
MFGEERAAGGVAKAEMPTTSLAPMTTARASLLCMEEDSQLAAKGKNYGAVGCCPNNEGNT